VRGRDFNDRMRKPNISAGQIQTPAPVINPLAVYTPDQARAVLGLAKSTLKAERRAGRLRIGKRGNRYFILGEWLLEWLRAGELPSRRKSAAVHSAATKEG
jgi:hypothetical protein